MIQRAEEAVNLASLPDADLDMAACGEARVFVERFALKECRSYRVERRLSGFLARFMEHADDGAIELAADEVGAAAVTGRFNPCNPHCLHQVAVGTPNQLDETAVEKI